MAIEKETTLSIPAMSCNHCVQTITKTLSDLVGVESVNVDLLTKTVYLAYDAETLSLAEAEAKLSEAGYPVQKQSFANRGKALPLK
ncbi:heavy-metal-associated domain-containing protein [Ktedonobacter robiniae]|uniref:Copper ion-binding protein n=1 Tax=Ktedonobacter robiniae TaxID=2778365 RepID=A0ABQ3V7G5_9CHLR|nr:cation transporter [Ktedonobacter robiniae]GHO60949.1 copper ion-binding protein [Ktedonobacter robiniae]